MKKSHINSILTNLERLDNKVDNSAKNLYAAFTIQIEALSSIFHETVTAVKSTIDTSFTEISATVENNAEIIETSFAVAAESINDVLDITSQTITENLAAIMDAAEEISSEIARAFIETAEEVNIAIQEMQILGSSEFAYLSENVVNSFMEAMDSIFVDADELNEKLFETSLSIKDSMTTAFYEMRRVFSSSISLMLAESKIKFGSMKNEGESTAEAIKESFMFALNSVKDNIRATMIIIEDSCREIRRTFSITANNASQEFEVSTNNINRNLGEFESKSITTNESAGNAFDESGGFLRSYIDKMARLNIIIGTYNGLVSVMTGINKMAAFAATKLAAAKAAVGIKAKLAAIGISAKKIALTLGVAAVPIIAGIALTTAAIAALPSFASGGFPPTGQMFLAREAGPELVGTIGSRTAVVNNDQIVESVSAGVFRAVREAMAGGSSGSGKPLEVKLYLDGKQITTAVERVQKERGLSIMNGGVTYGF